TFGPAVVGDTTPGAAVAKGVVVVGSYGNAVLAFDATDGTPLWTFPTGSFVDTTPAIVGSVVYVGAPELHALDLRTGSQRWQFAPAYVSTTATVSRGVVYVGSQGATLYAVDASTG